jgi:hypothetical protein
MTIVVHRIEFQNDFDFDYDYVVFLDKIKSKKMKIFKLIEPFLLALNARKNDMVLNLHLNI